MSLATLCHLAWAQVVARTSGREDVVFGTVLFGRMHGGVGDDRAMGFYINTLPVRLQLDAPRSQRVRRTHLCWPSCYGIARLARPRPTLQRRAGSGPAVRGLVELSAQQRTDHRRARGCRSARGRGSARGEERTNYPLTLSVEDFGDALGLTAQVVQPHCPHRVCDSMACVLADLAQALEHAPERPVRSLAVLAQPERALLLQEWNRTEAAYPAEACIHHLFEAQVRATPEAIALVHEQRSLSYAELNARANRLAHRLIAAGVEPDIVLRCAWSAAPPAHRPARRAQGRRCLRAARSGPSHPTAAGAARRCAAAAAAERYRRSRGTGHCASPLIKRRGGGPR